MNQEDKNQEHLIEFNITTAENIDDVKPTEIIEFIPLEKPTKPRKPKIVTLTRKAVDDKEFLYNQNLHAEDATYLLPEDTEYISEQKNLIKKNFDIEMSIKQIEALTDFRARGNENKDPLERISTEYLNYFNDDFKREELQNRFEQYYSEINDFTKIPKEIIEDLPVNIINKSNYKRPFSAIWKRFMFQLSYGKLYSYKKFNKNRKSSYQEKEKWSLQSFLKTMKIQWMLFVCRWHDYRIKTVNKQNKTHYTTKTLSDNFSLRISGAKALTYQDLYPQKHPRIASWFLNLKPIKALEIKLHNKYSKQVQNYVLDYIKKDLVFSNYESELQLVEPKKQKKAKRKNKPGKPYRVSRI